jgi:NADH-quinone oxidoreductase subunit C
MPRYTTSPRPPVEATSADAFARIAEAVSLRVPGSVERAEQDRGELTLYVRRTHLLEVLALLRDDPELRFELLSSVSGADYLGYPGQADDRRLHAVYHLTSLSFRRRIRVEVAVTVDDPHVPSAVGIYPTADWHERETWDFFGIVFDGHPGLTRIEMPDDWEGHPQRKDYPLGGVPVEYKGAQIPPPEDRRAWA